jgi:hypothetical protein
MTDYGIVAVPVAAPFGDAEWGSLRRREQKGKKSWIAQIDVRPLCT